MLPGALNLAGLTRSIELCKLCLNTSGDRELSTVSWEKVLVIRMSSLTGSPDPTPGCAHPLRHLLDSPRVGVPTLYADTSPNKKCPSEKLWCYESPGVLQAGFYSPDNQTFPEFSQAKCFISAHVLLEQQRKPWACLILLMEQTIHQRRLLKKVATELLKKVTVPDKLNLVFQEESTADLSLLEIFRCSPPCPSCPASASSHALCGPLSS